MEREGVQTVQKGEKADICIVNTCSVTDVADHKCRQAIHRFTREHPGAFVVVMGCYAQLKANEIATFPGVDLVLGMEQKGDVMQYIEERLAQKMALEGGDACHEAISVPTKDIRTFVPSCSRGDRTRYFLKVQDGCNYYCTYCTIPFARGNSRNPSIASLVAQAEQAAREGGKEIVLTGVNIGDFGQTTGEKFIDLVKALDGVEGIQRFRISSIEPDLISDELIEYCAASRAFMPHFHIPLQSGSDEVLKLMHRRYSRDLFAHKIGLIKQLMPDAFIGVDVMVGCRGETPECFDDSYAFLDSLPVTQLHVFPYSERRGTAALRINYVVADNVKKERVHKLLKLSDEKTLDFYARHIGKEAEVLFEKSAHGKAMHGFTRNYIRVELPPSDDNDRLDNEIVKVRLGELNYAKNALKGQLL